MLQDLWCVTQLPVKDLTRAKSWYSETLGLAPLLEGAREAHYRCGGQSAFTLYSSGAAGTSGQTAMAWLTADIEREVVGLKARGVVFESYDLPGLRTDQNGIAQLGEDRVAWFKDSEGNVLAIGQPGTGLLDLLDRG